MLNIWEKSIPTRYHINQIKKCQVTIALIIEMKWKSLLLKFVNQNLTPKAEWKNNWTLMITGIQRRNLWNPRQKCWTFVIPIFGSTGREVVLQLPRMFLKVQYGWSLLQKRSWSTHLLPFEPKTIQVSVLFTENKW